MRVLFVTHPRSAIYHGGMEIQMERTKWALEQHGVEVVLYSPWVQQIEDVDLCHIFSLDGSVHLYARKAAEAGKKVVVSTVYNCFSAPLWRMKIKRRLSACPGVYTDLRRSCELLRYCHKIVALNVEEKKAIRYIFDVPDDTIAVVPNGINKECMAATAAPFRERFGFSDFVLQVASIEPRKNQLTLIEAMRGLPHKLVLIGPPMGDRSYYERCRAASDGNVVFVGRLSPDDPVLHSAFHAARLFVLPSFSEVMPLTLYEAAVAGARIIASNRFPVMSALSAHISRFAPTDVAGLRRMIEAQMPKGRDPALAQAARQLPSWEEVGGMIRGLYEELLSG